jgi:phosphonate transport system substrate-binding protein
MSEADRSLTFAVVSSAPGAEIRLQALCAEISRGLGQPVSARVLTSYAALRDEVEAGWAAIAWAPPRVAIDLEDAGFASIDLCSVRGGQMAYHAALFTRHASAVETLSDLKGKHAAWVDTESAAGYLFPRLSIAEAGLDPDTVFGKESFLGTHARVAVAVLSGEADVGGTYLSLDPATRRPISAGWLDAGAGINGALLLAQAGPIPSDTIVFARWLDPRQKAEIVERVLALPAAVPEMMGRLFGAEGFGRAQPSHFATLREILKKKQALAPAEPR